MRYLYTFIFYLALPFIFVRLLWRSRKAPLYRKRWPERLGFGAPLIQQSIIIHAVSLGETIAAIPLIKAIKAKYPNIPLVITNMTPTGSARVKAVFGETVINVYLPYDLPDAVSRFLRRLNPRLFVIMETELWPNLFVACKKRNIPIVVTNARLSAKSAKGYQRIQSLMQEMCGAISALAAQAEQDAERFIRLGMPRERVNVTGSVKFDLELPLDLSAKGEALREILGNERPLWIAASTHPGEDEIILDAHQQISRKIPNALLILVPRHPERFNSVASLVKDKGFALARRSKNEKCAASMGVYLGDTVGEMMVMFAATDVAFVAGSFAQIGGHNIIEPAALKKPVITGPHLYNFTEISELMVKAGGMIIVRDANDLAQTVMSLFLDEKYRQNVGFNSFKVVEKNRGALQRQLDLIDRYV